MTDARFVLTSGLVTDRTLTVPDSDGLAINSVLSISTGNDHVHPIGFTVDGNVVTVRMVNMHSEGVWVQTRATVSLRKA